MHAFYTKVTIIKLPRWRRCSSDAQVHKGDALMHDIGVGTGGTGGTYHVTSCVPLPCCMHTSVMLAIYICQPCGKLWHHHSSRQFKFMVTTTQLDSLTLCMRHHHFGSLSGHSLTMRKQHIDCPYLVYSLALFPGPAQLFVTCSTEKCGEPDIFSHVNMT